MAVVESIYSSLILDTRQYEEALRKIVGISKDAEKTFDDGFKKGKASVDETTKSVDKMSGALKALGSAASFAAVVAGFKGMIDSAVQAESQIKGLAAVIKNKLGDEAVPQAAKMVKTLSSELGLTTGAVTQATKNLVSMGFSLADTEKLLRGATDMAVDNRQAHYDLSESVQVWTEGLKNNNSTLSDSIGISENISKQYSRLGVDADNLGDKFAGLADRQKLVNDFTNQFAVNAGRAQENLQGYSGATQSLNKSTSELSISIGQVLREGITPFVSALAKGVVWIADWAKNMGTMEKMAVTFAASLVTIGTAIVTLKGIMAVAAPQMAASLTLMTGGISAIVIGISATIALFSQLDAVSSGASATVAAESTRIARANGVVQESTKNSLSAMSKGFEDLRRNQNASMGTRIAYSQALINQIEQSSGLTREYKDHLKGLASSARDSEGAMKSLAFAISAMQTQGTNPVVPGAPGAGGTPTTSGGRPKSSGTDNWWAEQTGSLQKFESTMVKVNMQVDLLKNAKGFEGLGFNSKTLKEVGAGAKLAAMAISEVGQAASEMGNAMAGQATVKLQNFKQRLDFFANGLNFLAKQQADQRQAEFDAQMEQIAAQNQALLDQERAYQIERAALKAEFDESAKAENERLYQEALEMLRADMEAKKAENDANSADAEQRMINDEALQNDFEQSRIKLRSDFDQKLLDAIKVKDEQLSKNDKAQADKQLAAQTALQAEQVKLQKQKELDDKAADKANEDRTRAKALMEWQAGKAAFQMNKQIQMATIATQMAMTIMMSLAGVAMAFAQGGIPGGIAGMVFAGLITAMSLGAGAMAMGAVASMQYPPPPVFADGGIATQPSIFGEAGAELAIPFNNPGKDFGALKKEVADNLTNGTGGNVTNVYMEGIQINGSNMNPNELADFVAEKIRRDVYMAAAG
jgi:hypothetical protein